MLPEIRYLSQENENNYQYRVGLFENDQLNGFGFDTQCIDGKMEHAVGYYENGVLNGLGYMVSGNIIHDIGIYENGTLLSAEEFQHKAKRKRIEDRFGQIRGELFTNLYRYYLGDDPESGPTLFCSNEIYPPYDRANTIKDLVSFMEYDHTTPLGHLHIFIFAEKGLIREVNHFFYSSNNALEYAMGNYRNLNLSMFKREKIKVEEGTRTLEKGFCKPSGGIALYLPSSIKKLGPASLSSKEKYCLEVFYDGTKEEWEAIPKGKKKEYEKANPYYMDYYHHEPDPYVRAEEVIDWAVGAIGILIHCHDGDLLEYDKSHDW